MLRYVAHAPFAGMSWGSLSPLRKASVHSAVLAALSLASNPLSAQARTPSATWREPGGRGGDTILGELAILGGNCLTCGSAHDIGQQGIGVRPGSLHLRGPPRSEPLLAQYGVSDGHYNTVGAALRATVTAAVAADEY